MLSKSNVLIICILVFCDQIVVGMSVKPQKKAKPRAAVGASGEAEVEVEVKVSAEINFDLGKYGIANKGRFPGSGGPIGKIIGTGQSVTIRKGKLSGLAKLIDDRFITLDRFGNPYGGLPEDMLGHIRFCAEFIYNGLFVLVFITIRYPLKILSKAVLFTGAIGFILTYANWCVNPLAVLEFTSNGKKTNIHLERLTQFREEFKKRVIWITDHAQHSDRQMYVCCGFHEYKRKIYEEIPEAQNFAKFYHAGLYKLPELVWCWKYQMGSQACSKVDMSPTDEAPDRVVPQSFYTTCFELLDKFL